MDEERLVFIEVRSLAGVNYVRASDIVAVQYVDPKKCSIVLATGTMIQCTEAAQDVAYRVEQALSPGRELPKK